MIVRGMVRWVDIKEKDESKVALVFTHGKAKPFDQGTLLNYPKSS